LALHQSDHIKRRLLYCASIVRFKFYFICSCCQKLSLVPSCKTKPRSRFLGLGGGVETKSRFLDCQDKLFEIVKIFLTVKTYSLPVSRSRVLKETQSRQIETPQVYVKPIFVISLGTSKLQWAPLKGITLGPRQTDSINRMIPLTDTCVALLRLNMPWIP
jgi:hypothetical protein